MRGQVGLAGALLLAALPGWAQTGTVRIRVTDPLGSTVPTATASLLDPNDRPMSTLTANDSGEILWTELPLGNHQFWVIAPGFGVRRLTVTVTNREERMIDTRLEIGCLECVPDVDPYYMPYSDSLNVTPASSLAAPQTKPAKRKWWQIFR